MILRHTFTPLNNTRLANLCGPTDEHLRSIEAGLQIGIAHRHEQFKIDGPKKQAARALTVLQALYELADRPIKPDTVQLMLAGDGEPLREGPDGAVVLNTRRSDLKARTPNQSVYLDHIAS
ncbi:MAG TPA: PhoH family protein, partial [Ottowia sp.]|nr:PhoH family protein [Ottowia sp.]